MKTEKRLTMALSVLVALMMLAVPLASSSNLFVDGGQTNSNGDAPTLGAAGDTYILYFDFNVPENSLDIAELKKSFSGTVSATDNIGTPGDGGTAGSIEFSLIKGKTAQEDRILAYVKQPTAGTTTATLITIGDVITNLNTLVFDSREGYELVSWKGSDNNSYYSDSDAGIKENMNYTANWESSSVDVYLKNPKATTNQKSDYDQTPVTYEYKEFKVNVTIDGETKEYIKAYLVTEDADGNPIIEFDISLVTGFEPGDDTAKPTTTDFNKRLGEGEIAGIGSEGFLITNYLMEPTPTEGYYVPVYNIITTDSNKKVVYDSTNAQKIVDSISGDSKNSFNVNFELISTYTQIKITSILFNEDVVIYAYNGASFTYQNVLEFLLDTDLSGPEGFEPPYIKGDLDEFSAATGKLSVNDNKYVLTGWNGSILLNSSEKVTETSLTLNAEINSYNVIFMVNGEYEVVEVPFGTELSASLTKLDTNGVDHWVSPVADGKYISNSFAVFKEFRFSPDEIKGAEDASKAEGNKGLFVLIACFQPANKTAYAVFNANTDNAIETATFGNDLVKTIVIPGEINTPISQTPSAPVKEGKNLFMGWTTMDYKLDDGVYMYEAGVSDPAIDYNSAQKYNVKDKVSTYAADIQSYKWTISFSVDGSVIGVLYYNGSNTISMVKGSDNNLVNDGLIAYQYDGKIYKADDIEKGTMLQKLPLPTLSIL